MQCLATELVEWLQFLASGELTHSNQAEGECNQREP